MEEKVNVSVVVLASGFSSRFNGNKLIAALGGLTVIKRTVENARSSMASEVIVVVDPKDEAVKAEISGRITVIENLHRSEGISSSVKAGIAAVSHLSDGVIFMVGDQPFVTSGIIDRLIYRFMTDDCEVVACKLGRELMNPMLFHRSLFPELLEISGDAGGKQVAMKMHDEVCVEEISNPNLLFDIDTREDLEKAREILKNE